MRGGGVGVDAPALRRLVVDRVEQLRSAGGEVAEVGVAGLEPRAELGERRPRSLEALGVAVEAEDRGPALEDGSRMA